MTRIAVILFFALLPHLLLAQTMPRERSQLNYRLIGFSFPEMGKADHYRIEIAEGGYNREDTFSRNIVKRVESKSDRLLIEVPFFGRDYTWRVVATDGKDIRKSALHHFSTLTTPTVDTSVSRVRVTKNAAKYKDAYFFLDGTLALYDMHGNPIWFLPRKDELHDNQTFETRDLKLSPQGTITFLNNQIFEVNYNGEILWKGPDGGPMSNEPAKENVHHQFDRLENGHYMVLGFEFLLWDKRQKDRFELLPVRNVIRGVVDTNLMRLRFGTIIEYDQNDSVVWSWRMSQYFNHSDILYHIDRYGRIDPFSHDNAFFFDEKNKQIYISYRNISRILKIKYPEGTVENVYGEIYKPGVPENGNGLFCGQHCCRVSKQGYLYLFNNNECHEDSPPTIVMMQQPPAGGDSLKKVWEFVCPLEEEDKNKFIPSFRTGGSVQELPGGEIFSCMSTEYSKLFIVSREKRIEWSAMPEKWNSDEKKWERVHSYKANMIVSKEDLERLIWNSESPNK